LPTTVLICTSAGDVLPAGIGPSAIRVARPGGVGRGCAAIFLCRILVAVGRSLSMGRIVLPRISTALDIVISIPDIRGIAGVVDIRSVERIASSHVNIHVTVAPVARSPSIIRPNGAGRHAKTERKDRSPRYISGWIVVMGGVSGVRPRSVNNGWVVSWYVDNLGIGRFDYDYLGLGFLLNDDRLLLGRFQVAL
jgi:hypothetical protein